MKEHIQFIIILMCITFLYFVGVFVGLTSSSDLQEKAKTFLCREYL